MGETGSLRAELAALARAWRADAGLGPIVESAYQDAANDLMERLDRYPEDDAAELVSLRDENERLRALIDPEVSFKDLAMKMSDGTIDLRIVHGEKDRPALKWLAAVMFHAVTNEQGEPDNYLSTNFTMALTPAGQFDTVTCAIEVIKPGGKSSHEIRRDLEAEIDQLRASRPSEGSEG